MRTGFINNEGKNNSISGILLIDKPAGMTSFRVDSLVKRELNCLKVGHAGTLDPFATGLLPLLINKATKIQDRLVNVSKSYEGAFKIGISTNTLDISGEVLDNKAVKDIEIKGIIDYLGKLSGDFIQKIPAFSAKKVKGVPLYRYARKNIDSGKADMTNKVSIYEFKIKSFDDSFINFSCRVSKGTYVRAIAQDIIDKFKVPAHLFSLRRTSAGGFDINEAIQFESIEKGKDFIMEKIIPVDDPRVMEILN